MKAGHMACLLLIGLFSLSLTALTSCKKIPSSIPIGEQELPDMVLTDAKYTLGQEKEQPLVMTASKMTIYKTDRDTVLENVSFSRGTSLSGSCALASIKSDNRHAVLSGNVTIHQADSDNDATISAEEIIWDEDENSILCEGEVLVIYGDGTKIRAERFSALFDENRYEFGRIIEGSFEQ